MRIVPTGRAQSAAMMADGDSVTAGTPEPKAAPSASNSASSPSSSSSGYAPPSFDTTVFSDFVDNAQNRITEFQTQVQEIDTKALADDAKTTSARLIDNAIAGEWFDRGELYGAIQLLFVALLIRSPGVLDSVVGFFLGPVTLLAGAVLSGKAAFDLGAKQLSIWPSPVPGAELRTGGLYQYIRHPVYAGLTLASLGYAAATGSPERLIVTVALGFFLAKKITVEEEYLLEAYPGYAEYQKEVPDRLIPYLW